MRQSHPILVRLMTSPNVLRGVPRGPPQPQNPNPVNQPLGYPWSDPCRSGPDRQAHADSSTLSGGKFGRAAEGGALVSDDIPDHVLQRACRRPADEIMQLGNVGDPAVHVL